MLFTTFSTFAADNINTETFSGAWGCDYEGYVHMNTTTVYHIDGSYHGSTIVTAETEGENARIKMFIKGTWRIENNILYEINEGYYLIPLNESGYAISSAIESELAKDSEISTSEIVKLDESSFTTQMEEGGEKSCYRK